MALSPPWESRVLERFGLANLHSDVELQSLTDLSQSHTILGSKSQRGITQLSLDLLYHSLDRKTLRPQENPSLVSSLASSDASEAQIFSAAGFLDGIYGDGMQGNSRAGTPMTVGDPFYSLNPDLPSSGPRNQWSILSLEKAPCTQEKECSPHKPVGNPSRLRQLLSSQLSLWKSPRTPKTQAKLRFGNALQESNWAPCTPRRHLPQLPSSFPQLPDIHHLTVPSESNIEYAILVSMYEVYNDRIFDLLSHPPNAKDLRRRPLLFKSTEASPDRKVVAGLRKIVCGNYEEALMVLETGLMERRVAGTGSNSVSSRSHGFFCVEVKRRPRGGMTNAWAGAQLTVVDLAGKLL